MASGEDFEIEVITTKGDRDVDSPLPEIGGKGLFTAELEGALRAGKIDVAVHSLKDMPVENADGLVIAAIPEREDPRDKLIFNPDVRDPEAGSLPISSGCRVGSSSLRRRGALLNIRPDLELIDLRGNVPTRIEKLRRGNYDAIVLACAGLNRLGLDLGNLEWQDLPVDCCPPAPGQGALGIQCREGDARTLAILETIHDPVTALCVNAERRLLQKLGGGCSMPLGALIQPESDGGFRIDVGLFAEFGPGAAIMRSLRGTDPFELANRVAQELAPFIGTPLRSTSIVLLRPGGEGGELAAAMRVAGATVSTQALTELRPVLMPSGTWQDLPENPILAFSSPRAVDRLFEETSAGGVSLCRARLFAGGQATASAIMARGLACSTPASGRGGGSALAQHLLDTDLDPNLPIYYPCARDRHGSFENALEAAGRDVRPLVLYETHELPEARLDVSAKDIVVFTSPSAVTAYAHRQVANQPRAIAIGPTTAKAMQDADISSLGTASTATPAAMLSLLKDIQDA